MNKPYFAALLIAALIVGGAVGYALGYQRALSWAVGEAYFIMEHNGINISIDKNLIAAGVMAYKYRIENCIDAYYMSNVTR
jgi:hypothetical protein